MNLLLKKSYTGLVNYHLAQYPASKNISKQTPRKEQELDSQMWFFCLYFF